MLQPFKNRLNNYKQKYICELERVLAWLATGVSSVAFFFQNFFKSFYVKILKRKGKRKVETEKEYRKCHIQRL